MGNKIFKACIFLLILLTGVSLFIFPGNAFFGYKRAYSELMLGVKGREVRTLVLGDSHTPLIGPDDFGPATVSMASGSDSVREMYLKLLYALKEAHGIKFVFISADPQILCAYRYTMDNKLFIRDFVPRDVFDRVYGMVDAQGFVERALGSVPLFSSDMYVLARKKMLIRLSRFLSGKKDAPAGALQAQERSDALLLKDARHRAEDHFSSGKDKDLERYYREIIRLCKERGIKVIGLRYPVSPEYLKAAKGLGWQAFADDINAMAFDHLLDYATFFSDPASFANADHMARDAARVLVVQIRRDIANIGCLSSGGR